MMLEMFSSGSRHRKTKRASGEEGVEEGDAQGVLGRLLEQADAVGVGALAGGVDQFFGQARLHGQGDLGGQAVGGEAVGVDAGRARAEHLEALDQPVGLAAGIGQLGRHRQGFEQGGAA